MSKSVQNRRHGLVTQSTAQWMQAHKEELKDLPEPGCEWQSKNQPEHIQSRVSSLSANGLIERVGRNGSVTVFETKQRTYEKLRELWEKDTDEGLLPCGHDGFLNIGDGKLQCKRDNCKEIWTKTEVRNQ